MTAEYETLLAMSVPEAIRALESDLQTGLTSESVEQKRIKFGYNEIPLQKTFPALRFLKKFWGLSAWMLELILIISIILKNITDLYVVTGLLVVNAVISFLQENRASAAVEMLRSKLQVTARVLRDNVWIPLAARELVPGDIVRLRTGDLVPGDAKVIEGKLEVDQSSLTGESQEVFKGASDLLYTGSLVRRGECTAVIISTGTRTFFGRTTELVQLARPRLHAEEVVSRVVKVLFIIVGALLAVAVVFAIVRGVNLISLLPLLLVLLLGAVPVALPVMFTVSMALASQQLVKKGVLVSRLNASDDAATMDVLCVDKTGTITSNMLTITSVIGLNGWAENDSLLFGAMASQEANHDPIDMAFISAARERELLHPGIVQQSFTPFDASTRCTEADVLVEQRQVHTIKGAVANVAARCNLSAKDNQAVEKQTVEAAQGGQRVLAVAAAEENKPLQLIGLVVMSDLPRPDSARLIKELNELGVSVKMLTGDALPIAQQVASQIGIQGAIHKASEIEHLAKVDSTKAAQITEESVGIAEIYPEGKYLVVKSLQAGGHVVGMTGDGVNDAPALRQAEVGIAVMNATDVAKGAASVVLTTEGLASIVDLVKNGRMIYQRIATWIINKLSRTILKTAFVVFAYLITGKFVISAFSMILMMFMTDFVKISLSTDNARWSKKPETWNIIALAKVAVAMGVLMVLETLGLLAIGFRFFGLGSSNDALYTYSFATLLFFALFSIFVVRERKHFWDSWPSRTMLVAVSADFIIAILLITFGIPGLHPLPLHVTGFIIAYAVVCSLIINDFAKYLLVKVFSISW